MSCSLMHAHQREMERGIGVPSLGAQKTRTSGNLATVWGSLFNKSDGQCGGLGGNVSNCPSRSPRPDTDCIELSLRQHPLQVAIYLQAHAMPFLGYPTLWLQAVASWAQDRVSKTGYGMTLQVAGAASVFPLGSGGPALRSGIAALVSL